MKISLIVPCYNEQDALPIFYEEVIKVIDKMQCEYEIIFVNDGSKDKTLEILKNFQRKMEMSHIFLFQETLEKKPLCMLDFVMRGGIILL